MLEIALPNLSSIKFCVREMKVFDLVVPTARAALMAFRSRDDSVMSRVVRSTTSLAASDVSVTESCRSVALGAP